MVHLKESSSKNIDNGICKSDAKDDPSARLKPVL